MASTTQEKTMLLEGMAFAEFADPSYFVFANRASRMAQERKIAPGMAWKLFNDAIPEACSPKTSQRESTEEIISPTPAPKILDDYGMEMNFQDPWEGMREIKNPFNLRNAENGPFDSIASDLDVSCFFFGY